MPAGSLDIGEVTNFMSIDAYKVQEHMPNMPYAFIAPFMLIFGG